MIKNFKKHRVLLGLTITIAVALLMVGMTCVIFYATQDYERMQEFLYDCGIDVLGALVCAALYFGCMKQEGDGAKIFRTLNVLASASFATNFFIYSIYIIF